MSKKSFDDILKEGKDKGSGSASVNSPQHEWRIKVRTLMNAIHDLNDMYGDDKDHFVDVEQKSCKKCKKASFIIVVHNLKDKTKVMKFYRSKWKKIKDYYLCDECSKSI